MIDSDWVEGREAEAMCLLSDAEHGVDRTESWVGSALAVSNGLEIVVNFFDNDGGSCCTLPGRR